MHPQVKNYIFKILNQKTQSPIHQLYYHSSPQSQLNCTYQSNRSTPSHKSYQNNKSNLFYKYHSQTQQQSDKNYLKSYQYSQKQDKTQKQKQMRPTSPPPKLITQLICQKHQNANILLICSVPNCKQNRKICELCKQKQSLHISYHSNYIFKLKQFYQFKQSKLIIPKLQKDFQDLKNFIHKHKQYYKQQIQKINTDIDQIIQTFIQTTNQYKTIYISNFEKQINAFDKDLMEIGNNLKNYANQKSHQQSFFTKLFNNDKTNNDIEDIIQKNTQGFQVRASIMTLKSKVANSKVSKTLYKGSPKQQKLFDQLLNCLDNFCVSFYDKFKDLLISNSENQPTSPERNNLKSSIVSQTKQLSISKVSSQTQIKDLINIKKSSVTQKKFVKCNLPNLHPKVAQIKKFLKPFPNYSQNNYKQQGPYKYQTGTYLGNYQNGVRSGKGIFIFEDGSYYQGNWQNDNMSGYGRLIKSNSYYEGEIRDGCAHGKGNYQDFQRLYNGQWRNDLRHGIGQEEFKNRKRKYVGNFTNDKYEGRGKLNDQQFIYEGQFKAGFYDGEGLMKYKNGQIFKGSFKENQRVYGRHTFPDGSYYEGTFRDNMPDGNGDFYWPDGIKYSGQWKNGLQQGIGIETLANGKQLKGLWQNGVWIRWIL